MEIILASSSPRRKEILESLGLKIKVISPQTDESIKSRENPVDYARRISLEKGEAVLLELANVLSEESLIIACDTIVYANKKILGKPKNLESARNMLLQLRNGRHHVISALTVIHNSAKFRKKGLAHNISSVQFRDFALESLERYLQTNEWQGKAGSYAIQGQGSFFLDWFKGSLTSIIGFPMGLFFKILCGLEMDILKLWEHDN